MDHPPSRIFDVPRELENLFGDKPSGQGVRNYNVEVRQFNSLASAIGLDLPVNLCSTKARVHVYIAPFDRKGVSPLWQDGAFGLAICGTSARRAVAKDHPWVRVLVSFAHGQVRSTFLVGHGDVCS